MQYIKKILISAILVLGIGCFIYEAYAQIDSGAPKQEKIVKVIEIKGNKNVSKATILTKIKTLPQKAFWQNTINEDLKTLYATGFFTDVSVDIEDYEDGVKVIFIVKEKPVVRKIVYEGNTVFKENHFVKKIKTKADDILNYRQLKEDTEEIVKMYEKKGYTTATANYKVDIDKSSHMADVKIIINEGKKLCVTQILVEGNKAFDDKKIISLMATKTQWFFFRQGHFKEDVLEEDVERIKAFYENEGFIDVMVEKKVSVDEKKKTIAITLIITENKRYMVGTVTICDNYIFSEKELRNKIQSKPDNIFSPGAVRDDAASIQSYYFDKGYIFAYVDANTLLNPSTQKIDVKFSIREGQIAYVDKIKIEGNVKTKDFVIRRELRLSPGERFDGQKLRRSKERLYNLGYFEDVSFDTLPGAMPTKRDLLVNVKESKTGEFSFGGGFSSIEKLMGFVEIKQKNFDLFNFPSFTGAGQYVFLRGQFGSSRKDLELSFTEPWMFGKPFAFGFDVFHRTFDRSKSTGWSYDERDVGFDVRLGKELGEFLKGDIMYKYQNVKISNVPDSSSQVLKDELGKTTTSSVRGMLERDSRDSVYSPTRGNVTSLAVELAGGPFLGDKDFWKTEAETDWYFAGFRKCVLELRARIGFVDIYSDTQRVPIYERFYAGGSDTVRGYQERQIGPRDENTNDPVGGNSMLLLNAEYTVPLMDFLKAAVFYDAGNVWEKTKDFGKETLRQGTGVGVRVKTPLGPMKLDYGYPLNPQKGDKKKGRFHFNLTKGF